MKSKEKAAELLFRAGITLNGPNPWDIQVHDERLYDRVFAGGSTALGEAYMDGWWDAKDLPAFFYKILRSKVEVGVQDIGTLWYVVRAFFTNMQNRRRAYQVGEVHYDVGNDLYKRMLDARMVYSCAYWSSPAGPREKSV